jgi:hypothetical protein
MFARVSTLFSRTAPGALLIAGTITGTAAGAVTAKIDTFNIFDRAALAGAQSAKSDFLATHTITNLHTETFDSFAAWNGSTGSSDPQNTQVGSFRAGGTTGTGRSVINGGTSTEVRNDNTMFWGRYDTDEAPFLPDGHYLDSNDNKRIDWTIEGIGGFNTILFFVIDAADVGGKFSIKAGETRFANLAGNDGRLENGNIHLVRISLAETVDQLDLRLMHDRSNDGFAIDNIAVMNVAPVPVPPAAALLLTGTAVLAGLRRRRNRT